MLTQNDASTCAVTMPQMTYKEVLVAMNDPAFVLEMVGVDLTWPIVNTT